MSLLIVHVHVYVLPEFVDAFCVATRENAAHSVREPGIARFDVIQQEQDPTRFVLVEVYRYAEATGEHKVTAHYLKWREAVEPMMREPRRSVRYVSVAPDVEGW